METIVQIHLWGELVGAMAYEPDSTVATFEYTPQWLQGKVEIAPIQMPLSSARQQSKYRFPHLNPATYKGLPAVFADTLPDDFGNAVINAWLARQGRDPGSFTALERLLYTGKRGMGALEYAPAIKRPYGSNPIELESLVAMAQAVLDQRAGLNLPLGKKDQQQLGTLLQVGTSAGGARAKALVALNGERTQIRSGQTDAPPGFEHFLLKFDGVSEQARERETFGDPMGFGRMEYAYYQMALDAGIQMSPCELLLDGPRAHFLTKRFDRAGSRKLHYQSLCAMAHADYNSPGHYSYEQLFSLARQLRLSRPEAVELYRRMVFNLLGRNCDDHTKNTGFLLPDAGSRWQLAPAFDIAYSYRPGSHWISSHQMSLNGKRDNFNREDLMAGAQLIANFNKEASQIIQQVQAVLEQWPSYAQKVAVPGFLIDEVRNNLQIHIE